jgi:septal ring factor EnvC (AmiA/AmiB activator)
MLVSQSLTTAQVFREQDSTSMSILSNTRVRHLRSRRSRQSLVTSTLKHAKLAQANYQMVTILQQRDKERAAAQTLILHQRRRLQASEQRTRELEQQINELKVAMASGNAQTFHMSQDEHC